MNYPVVVLGSGGHARVVIDTLEKCHVRILGIVTTDAAHFGKAISGIQVLGNDSVLARFKTSDVRLVNAIGSVSEVAIRKNIYLRHIDLGYEFVNVIHPSAVVARDVLLGQGVQIMAGVVVQPGCYIGDNVLINTKSSIDHDSTIGDHSHVGPGCTLSGQVTIGVETHVGVGATVIQGISIGSQCMVAAGATVIRDVKNGCRVAGVPAKGMDDA